MFTLQLKCEDSLEIKGILGINTKWNEDGHVSVSTVVAVKLKNLAKAELLRLSFEKCSDIGNVKSAKWCTIAEIIELGKIDIFDSDDLVYADKFVKSIPPFFLCFPFNLSNIL